MFTLILLAVVSYSIPNFSAISIRRDINKTSVPTYSHLMADCVYRGINKTHTIKTTGQEPRKRIDFFFLKELSRHFLFNFVSAADETRITRLREKKKKTGGWRQ